MCTRKIRHFLIDVEILTVSAWDDGNIYVFHFVKENGEIKLKPRYDIRDAHNKGVTAIAVTSAGDKVVSGGGEGQVRQQLSF